MDPEHNCWWIRRKQSEISDDGTGISGAGMPRPAIERTASLLGSALERHAAVDDEYGESIVIGNIASGGMHDECFFCLQPGSAMLKDALVQALLEWHGKYLGIAVDWAAVRPAILERFGEGITVRLRSDKARQRLSVLVYPKGTTWLRRLCTKPLRVECGGGVGYLA